MNKEQRLQLAIAAAKARSQQPAQPNPDGTYGQPPEGMFYNPQTGQMTSAELVKNELRMREEAGAPNARGAGDAFASGAAHGVTLGFSDEIGDKVLGIPAELSRAYAEYDREANPAASWAGEIGGAVSVPMSMGAKAATRGGRIIGGARQAGRAGAVYGMGVGEGDFKDRIPSMAEGAMFGAATGGALAGGGEALRGLLGKNMQNAAIRSAAKDAPTSDQLRAEGARLYDEIDNAGVQIKAQSVEDARQKIVDALKSGTAYSTRPGGKTITPNTAAVMDDFGDMTSEMLASGNANPALPFRELDHLRRQAGAAAGNVTNKSDQRAGMTVIEGLDDLVKGLGQNDVAAGDIQALQSALPKARDVWSRMSKSQMIDDAMSSEGNYLSGNASAIRNQFARILRSPKLSRGFNEAERAAMKRVVHGNIGQQLINYAGSGLGMMGQVGLGMAAGPVGTVAGLAGAAASRKMSEAMTAKNAEIARALVANGRLKQLPQIDMNRAKILEALIGRGAVAAQQ